MPGEGGVGRQVVVEVRRRKGGRIHRSARRGRWQKEEPECWRRARCSYATESA